ncbi:MAG: UDP-N-acetylmuramoyl-L-alanyl-D-glutamate--2,6-diaminopimelate ligase [Verrucomicrobiota bacterium]|nr:UDP-N-acetylmuramoyl-L-alanyl-D-glutamate--2,6-diaminopimelate ligase [Verrucomicrobiota bacterium]
MKLCSLVEGLPVKIFGDSNVEIRGLSLDSRQTKPGDLFLARRGSAQDGTAFAAQAVQAGARALMLPLRDPFLKVTQVVTEDVSRFTSLFAARFYDNPSRKLRVIGVTGSKGKTTSCYLIYHLLSEMGLSPGLMSTVECVVGERRFPSQLTTNDIVTQQKWLCEMVGSGSRAAVMEVSSHGLDQGRVEGIAFDLALFTNLFPDHLDYHGTTEAYAAAKKKLFQMASFAIYNADSPWASFMKGPSPSLTFGIDSSADLVAEEVRQEGRKLCFRLSGEHFETNLFGKHNLYNLLGAIAVGVQWGVSLPKLAAFFRSPPQVPGRLEEVPNRLGISLFVDYAHTGPSLLQVLQAIRERGVARLFVVFGSGGGRDPARRKEMGKAAAEGADILVVTTDNPRDEDPEEICREILAATPPEKVHLELDRARAIAWAIERAEKGDAILIAGKGHEKRQIFAHRSIPFDDLLVAQEELQKRENPAILPL